jgi:hypothetical protein
VSCNALTMNSATALMTPHNTKGARSVAEKKVWVGVISAPNDGPTDIKRVGSLGSIISSLSATSGGNRSRDKLLEVRTLNGLTTGHLERLIGMMPPPSSAAAAAGGQGASRHAIIPKASPNLSFHNNPQPLT